MQKETLKELSEEKEFMHDNIEKHEESNKYLQYCAIRTEHLKLMWELYKKQKEQDAKKIYDCSNYLIGKLYINQIASGLPRQGEGFSLAAEVQND